MLVRGDVDAKPGATIGDGDERLRSMLDTLRYGIDRGWKQVIFGHIGRKPDGSLKAVARRIGELIGKEVPLLTGWWDEGSKTISSKVADAIASADRGSVLVLENTRQYIIERVLWEATTADVPKLVPELAQFANEFAAKVARCTSTRPSPRAASTAHLRLCPRRWIEWRLVNTWPKNSMDQWAAASMPSW